MASIIMYCPKCVDMMDTIAMDDEDTGYYYCHHCNLEWKITKIEEEQDGE